MLDQSLIVELHETCRRLLVNIGQAYMKQV